MINSITIQGTTGKEGVLRYSQSGTPILSFSLAVQHQGDKVSWFDCSMYGKYAETNQSRILRGERLVVTGRFESSQYEWKGEKRTRLTIHVSDYTSLSSRPRAETQPEAEPKTQTAMPQPEFTEQDIPF
jgi:single-strand DNA-binding protein